MGLTRHQGAALGIDGTRCRLAFVFWNATIDVGLTGSLSEMDKWCHQYMSWNATDCISFFRRDKATSYQLDKYTNIPPSHVNTGHYAVGTKEVLPLSSLLPVLR